jgi:hypothetical protein
MPLLYANRGPTLIPLVTEDPICSTHYVNPGRAKERGFQKSYPLFHPPDAPLLILNRGGPI